MERKVKVRAVMTAPRHEITYCRTVIDTALQNLGVPLQVSLGVFYAQHMQNMFEQAVRDEIDYVVSVDYDSVFTSDQLHQLISTCDQENFDALCAMQARRGKPALLGFKAGHSSAEWNGYPLQVDAAHFGLTVFNVAKIATTSKPWFCCQPAADGTWGDGRIDADVWFWKQWAEAGNKIWMDPSVRIGHVEEMVAMYDGNMKVRHYYPKVWDKVVASVNDEIYEGELDDTTLEGVEAETCGDAS